MGQKRTSSSFSLIKKFRRKQTTVRIALCLICLCVLNFYAKSTIPRTIGNCFIECKVYISNFFEKLSGMYHYFGLQVERTIGDEISALKVENMRLQWQIKQLEGLRTENTKLREMLDLREKSEDDIVIAKVSTVFVNDFARAGIINVGSGKGVRVDDVVINKDGLVGRIIEVHTNWSKLFFVTDENFNVPTKIGIKGANAIVTGFNPDMLRISLIHDDIHIKDGDKVCTSEYGAIFKAEIPVGTVINHGSELCVRPCVDFNALNYVAVIINHDSEQNN